ncbi:MAG TPA: hypothetical protein ENH85_01940 [Candidatus Scalindua sp.]|nr:hypothetical protein [Candidatus Scalindua sp.]
METEGSTGLEEIFGSGVIDEKPQGGETEASPEEKSQEASEDSPSLETEELETDSEKVKEERTDEKVDGEETKKPETDDTLTTDYESDDNPYKKQINDTRAYANTERQDKLRFEAENKQLRRQIDGDYTEEPTEPSPEMLQEQADLSGRLKASFKMANEKFGETYVMDNIDKIGSPFQIMRSTNPTIDIRVKASDTPYMEAVKVLKEEQFFEKYGRNPDKIVENITKEIESKIRETVTKEFQKKITKKESLPEGISEARSSQLNEEKSKEPTHTPLDEVFAL